MPSLIVDDAPVNGVDAAAVTTNGVKVNGVHAEEPAMTPAVPVPTPDAPVNTPPTSEAAVDTPEKKEEEAKTDDESDDEKEMKARKKELDALNAEYKDVAHGSKTELIHLDKVHMRIFRTLAT